MKELLLALRCGEFNANWAVALDGNHVSGRTTSELPEFIDAITVTLLK